MAHPTSDHPDAGMRIGVNLSALTLGGGGMRQYVLQLLPWMLGLSAHHLVVFYHLQGWPSLASVLRRLRLPERRRIETIEIDNQDQIFAHADRFDVYFAPLNGLGPDLLDRPTLSTLADVQEQFFPEYFTPEQLRQRALVYRHTAHAVTTLLTLSEFSKKSICDAFDVPPQKVRAIHLAPNDEIVTAAPHWPCELGEPPGRFIFYPANLYPHKGHTTLLDALVLLKQRGIDCGCVLTGQPAQPGIDIEAEIASRALADRVRWLGHVAAPTLRWLYENALALCFPSQFEGFGMPLVEAMLCGCPIVATSAACIPETVGEAALLVDSTPAAFADAIAGLLAEPARRKDLIAHGHSRAAHFTARRLAEQTLQAIDETVASFHPSRPQSAGAGTLTFVVRPATGGRALLDTLASIAFEAEEHDEVLLLASPEQLDAAAQALCSNLGIVRFIPPGQNDWLEAVSRERVWLLQEGERPCEGAARAALTALADKPASVAVVGQVLQRRADGGLTSVEYLPPRAGQPRQWHGMPSCAVVWRTAFLREKQIRPAGPEWVGAALRQSSDAAVLYRTFATTPAPGRVGGARGKALVRRMPRWLQRPLRDLYSRMAARGGG